MHANIEIDDDLNGTSPESGGFKTRKAAVEEGSLDKMWCDR